jgi:chromosome segregation ATPase
MRTLTYSSKRANRRIMAVLNLHRRDDDSTKMIRIYRKPFKKLKFRRINNLSGGPN